MYNTKLLACVLAVALQAVVIGSIPYLMYGWYLTTPDAGGWACGAQTLAGTGEFSDGHTGNLGYNFNICWTEETYPALQYLLAGLVQLTQLQAYLIVPWVMVVTFCITALIIWLIAWRFSESLFVATLAGLFASSTPIVLRALLLTPQNLFGYLLISLLLLLVIELLYSKHWWWWIGIVLIAGLLGYVHSLSFGVAGLTCAVWFYVWYLPNWKWRLGLGLLGLLGAIVVWSTDISPVSPQTAYSLFTGGAFAGYDHPLYDHPAFLGYGLVILATVGILYGRKYLSAAYGLLITWLVVPLMLGHLSWFGLVLMPDRFIAYIWISVVLFAAVGSAQLPGLFHWLPWKHWLAMVVVIAVLGAQITHTVLYIEDDVGGWSNRFKPHEDFIAALEWLNEQPQAGGQGVVVGIMAVANREITFAPMWYDGPIASYPWYNLNHKNLKAFKANSGLYQSVFSDPTSAEYLRVSAFYHLIAKPNSNEAKTAAQTYQLSYLIFPKKSQADGIWQNNPPSHFPQIYENSTYRIFQLQ